MRPETGNERRRRVQSRAWVIAALLACAAPGCVIWPRRVWIAPEVKGRAVDVGTGISVSGATVRHVPYPRVETRTDGHGYFTLPGVSRRRWVVLLAPATSVIPGQVCITHPRYRMAVRSFGILNQRTGEAPARNVGVVPMMRIPAAR